MTIAAEQLTGLSVADLSTPSPPSTSSAEAGPS